MRAVVTGGAGFIGSHLIEALVRRGHEAVSLERPGTDKRWIAALPVMHLECGIHDEAALRRAFAGADIVFHLAGMLQARQAADFYRVNTIGTEQVLKAAAAHGERAPHVILLSSLAALGPCRNGDPLGPDSVPFPISHYGHSKLLAEAMVHAYAEHVLGTIVRLPAVYGPRDRAVLKFFQLVRHGFALTIGAWDREVSMIYVKDVVEGLIAAAATDRSSGRIYCLAHPEPTSWRGFARAAAAAMRAAPIFISVPCPVARAVALTAEALAALRGRAAILNREKVRELTQQRWVCDPSRSLAEIGFQPAYALAAGIEETALWYRQAQWL